MYAASSRLLEAVLEQRATAIVDEHGGLDFDGDSPRQALAELRQVFEQRLAPATRRQLEQLLGAPSRRVVDQAVRDWLYPRRRMDDVLVPNARRLRPEGFVHELVGRLRAHGVELVVRGGEHGQVERRPRRWVRVPLLAAMGLALGWLCGLSWRALGLQPQTPWGLDPATLGAGLLALLGAVLGVYWTLGEPATVCSECVSAVTPDARRCEVCEALLDGS